MRQPRKGFVFVRPVSEHIIDVVAVAVLNLTRAVLSASLQQFLSMLLSEFSIDLLHNNLEFTVHDQ